MTKRSNKLCLMVGALSLSAFAMSTLATEPTGGPAVTTPKYLSIPEVKQCLGEKTMGTWTSVCVPAAKPAACPETSWRQLNALTGPDRVPGC